MPVYSESNKWDEQGVLYLTEEHESIPKIIIADSFAVNGALCLGDFKVGVEGDYRIWWNDCRQLYEPLGFVTAGSDKSISVVEYSKKLSERLERFAKTDGLKYLVIDAELNGWYKEKDIRFSLSSAKIKDNKQDKE